MMISYPAFPRVYHNSSGGKSILKIIYGNKYLILLILKCENTSLRNVLQVESTVCQSFCTFVNIPFFGLLKLDFDLGF